MRICICFFILSFYFIGCQKTFEFNEEEKLKLINEKLYSDLYKIEHKRVLLNEQKLTNPDFELLDFNYEKEKESLNKPIEIHDTPNFIKKSKTIKIPPPPLARFSNEKWKQNKINNFMIIKENDSLRSNNKFIFSISNPIYDSKNKIALITIEKNNVNGWNCIINEKYFLYERVNNNWVSLKQNGTHSVYLTLLEYYQNKERNN